MRSQSGTCQMPLVRYYGTESGSDCQSIKMMTRLGEASQKIAAHLNAACRHEIDVPRRLSEYWQKTIICIFLLTKIGYFCFLNFETSDPKIKT